MYEHSQNFLLQPKPAYAPNFTKYPTCLCHTGRWARSYGDAHLHGPRSAVPGHQAPSGAHCGPQKLHSFDQDLHHLITRLIINSADKQKKSHSLETDCVARLETANALCTHSFNLPIDDDTFTRTSSDDPNRATPSLADNINTKFAEGQGSSAWRFNAGTDGSAEPVRRHSGSTTLSGQGSSADAQPSQRASKSNPDLQSVKSEGSFNADGWSDKFGPQTFAPRQESASFSSSATANRANLRKSKPAKPTAGPAAVIEDSSDDDVYEWAGRKGQARAATVESPQAMDIDPPTSSETPNEGIPSSNGARNIPVEPSRPEWRSGDLERSNASKGIEHKDRNQFDPNTAGSEDSEEFRTSFADLKNVEPFSQQNQGLKSLSDLKDNLPFESKASGETPVKMPKPPTLVFPEPPQAPRLPPTVAISGMKPNAPSWNKYLQEFMDYLQRWDTFNADVVDHFSTRKANINEQRKERGYSFLGLRSDSDVQEYYNWIQQDNEVRRRWLEACEEHERQYRAFLTFREKMK